MRKLMIFGVALAVAGSLLGGCAPADQGGDYKEPEEGSYKTQEQVPERAGRTKAEAGGNAGSGMGRSEGG